MLCVLSPLNLLKVLNDPNPPMISSLKNPTSRRGRRSPAKSLPVEEGTLQVTAKVPVHVWQHLAKVAGESRPVATMAAMVRQALVDWSEANKATR